MIQKSKEIRIDNPHIKSECAGIKSATLSIKSRNSSVVIPIAVDILRLKSQYFKEVLDGDTEDADYCIPEDYPEEAAQLILELHKVIPNITQWNTVWAELSRKWQMYEVFDIYNSLCAIRLTDIISKLTAINHQVCCVIVANSRHVELNGIYELRQLDSILYFEKQCSVRPHECYRLLKCPMQNSISTLAPLTNHWTIGKFPSGQAPQIKELKSIWVPHAYIFKANFEAISFQQSLSTEEEGVPHFSENGKWVDYSTGKVSSMKVFTHLREISLCDRALKMDKKEVESFWELASFWLHSPSRPKLFNEIATKEDFFRRIQNFDFILSHFCLQQQLEILSRCH